jgi:rubrerythrin
MADGCPAEADAILAQAIEKEAEASRLYSETAEKAADGLLASMLWELMQDEDGHRRELEALRAQGTAGFHPETLLSLNIAEYLGPTMLSPEANLKEALEYAMQRENDAWRLYLGLADASGQEEERDLYQRLAVMENSHKARLEEQFYRLFLAGA